MMSKGGIRERKLQDFCLPKGAGFRWRLPYFKLFQLNPTTVSQPLTESSNPPSTRPEGPTRPLYSHVCLPPNLSSDPRGPRNRMSYARQTRLTSQNLPALVEIILALAWAQIIICDRFVAV